MLYAMHEATYYASMPARLMARAARDFWSSPINPAASTELGRSLYAGADLFANVTRRYGRPAWGIDSVTIDGAPVRVRPVEIWRSPWVKLLHFVRDTADLRRARARGARTGRADRRPALRAPRDAAARHGAGVPCRTTRSTSPTGRTPATCRCSTGRFDFHDYIDQVSAMIRAIGPRAARGRGLPAGTAGAGGGRLMAEDDDPARPASLTFMGSPIDARLSPTVANRLAEERPFTWFQRRMIYTVPAALSGRAAARLSGLRAALQLHADEPRAAPGGAPALLRPPGQAATATPPTSIGSSTTSTSRSWTSPKSSTCRPSRSCSSSYLLPKGELTHRGRLVRPRGDHRHRRS